VLINETEPDHALIGGKAANIVKLQKWDIKIPPGFILTTRGYDDFKKGTLIEDQIVKLSSFNYSPKHVIQISTDFTALFIKTNFSDYFLSYIEQAYSHLMDEIGNKSSLAVRSSAAIEDGRKYSFAGQAESYLFNISFRDVVTSIKKCWASLFSPQALLYYLRMRDDNSNFSINDLKMAIIIQKMVNADISGVLFTANVLNNDTTQILINSTWGACDAITANSVIPDLFVLKKETRQIIKAVIGKKEKMSIKNRMGSSTELIDTEPHLCTITSLNEEQLMQLYDIGIEIEQRFNQPQDIEWAFEDGKLYILQSRPITSLD
jgi:phosphoenolpyruvate synthase/pyruvate phosphate dikinase